MVQLAFGDTADTSGAVALASVEAGDTVEVHMEWSHGHYRCGCTVSAEIAGAGGCSMPLAIMRESFFSAAV